MEKDRVADRALKPARAVCNRYGRTTRTLERWLKDEDLNFPRPLTINGRRYFYQDELVAWERAQAAASKRAA
jgi:hypothetical protein